MTYTLIGEGKDGKDKELATAQTKTSAIHLAGVYVMIDRWWAVSVYSNGRYIGHAFKKQTGNRTARSHWMDPKGESCPIGRD